MKNWHEIYKSRVVSAHEAVSHIKSGNRVVVGHASGSPEVLLKALVNNKDAYKNVEIVHMVSMGASEYCLPEMEKHFVHNSLFAGATTRKAIHDGRACFTVSHFSQIPQAVHRKDPACGCDPVHGLPAGRARVLFLRRFGRLHQARCGELQARHRRGDAEHAQDPGRRLHPCLTDRLHRGVRLQPHHPAAAEDITEIDEKIGGYCAELIRDGDCLQLGIGAVPDSILGFLKQKKDLGIHTEMFSDGVVDLVEAGVITCARKNFHPGKMVATFFMGTEKLYKFVHNNPMVQMFSVNYTNNPAIIAQNDNMVSVNSTLQVDLTGQAASESIGYKQFSGTGGQADFIRGAAWSKGGRSILAFHSTASGDKISRIVSAPGRGGRGHHHPERHPLRGDRIRHRGSEG